MSADEAIDGHVERIDSAPRLMIEIFDPTLGSVGFLVIHSLLSGTSLGGIRFAPGVTVDEVVGLARAMTLKCSFLNIAMGGAKAGIPAPEGQNAAQRCERLGAFGRGLALIVQAGLYIPGQDIGVSVDDLNIIHAAAGLPPVTNPYDGGSFTARTTVVALEEVFENQGWELADATTAIEGFGSVGSSIATMLEARNTRVVSVSTAAGAIYDEDGLNVQHLRELRAQYGDACVREYPGAQQIELSSLLELDVNVLIPCARPWCISESNVDRIRAKAVVPAGNNPITAAAEKILTSRGVLCFPDFVANCGSVLAGTVVAQGFSIEDAELVIDQVFRRKIKHLLVQAEEYPRLNRAACTIAWRNHERMVAREQAHRGRISRLVHRLQEKGVRRTMRRGEGLLYRRYLMRGEILHRAALDDLSEEILYG